ncbi:Os10g0494950 [Oryza sativa Japonica Group]|uniref:Os10g0494950 protein n=1 Tax=Oryza sativa subsp. japonica TaxID=39947 RepID=A0A0P0XW60_ORYSJ|nr:Os10g0494950 [Oryza sativa Japonica Group]
MYSLCFSPFRSDKLVAGAAQSAPLVPLQEPDVSSLGESFDTTSSQDLITASHNIIDDGSSSTCPSRIDKPVADATLSTSLQDVALSLLDEIFDDNPRTAPDNTTTDGYLQSASSSVGSSILVRSFVNCYQLFYIRIDPRGSCWTYPDVGGPFQRVDEADDAIKCFLDELQHGARCTQSGEFSRVDRMIHDCKHYLYGPPKRDPSSPSSKTTYDEKQYLVQAILDQYNDDNKLFGNHAYELEDLVSRQLFCENCMWYCHFNFTAKQKGADDSSGKLFFAEVTHVQRRMAWKVSCFCKIDTEVNGGHCYGCRNKGTPPMKHPQNTNAYAGGHLDVERYRLVLTSSSEDVRTFTFRTSIYSILK